MILIIAGSRGCSPSMLGAAIGGALLGLFWGGDVGAAIGAAVGLAAPVLAREKPVRVVPMKGRR